MFRWFRRRGLPLVFVAACVAAVASCRGSDAPPQEQATTPAPAASPAVAPAPQPDAEPLEPEITEGVPDATVTASSEMAAETPAAGVLHARHAGWHSQKPPKYPEWVQVRFQQPQRVSKVSILPQHMYGARAPAQFDIQVSDNGKAWKTLLDVENGCVGDKGRWRSYTLPEPVTTSWVRLNIRGNCGDAEVLTFRGLKFES